MSNFNRRDFLKASALSALGFAASTHLPMLTQVTGGGSLDAEAAPDANHTTILIFLRGGIDGLSWIPPQNSTGLLRTRYEAARPTIKYDALPLTGSAFGVNSNLPGLQKLLTQGKLSIINGFGSINDTTSHFNQMDHIEGGHSQRRVMEGFFQRAAMEGNWNKDTDLVALETALPGSLRGNRFVLQYSTPADLADIRGSVTPGLTRKERLERNYLGSTRIQGHALAMAQQSAGLATQLASQTITLDPLKPVFSPVVEAARMLKAGIHPKVITMSISGWDFHNNLHQRFIGTGTSANMGLGSRLVNSLEFLAAQIPAAKWNSTTVIVMGEFGRRMVENGSNGDDHGRGGIGIVMGGKVNGGKIFAANNFHTELANLYGATNAQQSQVPVKYDYRLLFSEILQKRHGISDAKIKDIVFNDRANINVIGGFNPVLLKA